MLTKLFFFFFKPFPSKSVEINTFPPKHFDLDLTAGGGGVVRGKA